MNSNLKYFCDYIMILLSYIILKIIFPLLFVVISKKAKNCNINLRLKNIVWIRKILVCLFVFFSLRNLVYFNFFQLDDEQLAKKLQEEENNFRSRPRSVKRVPVSKDFQKLLNPARIELIYAKSDFEISFLTFVQWQVIKLCV